mmetsp:Transcript_61916/g.146592  ORF Transcript_61916/g.146592 Transcript_61916/m.146592 type:complete len:195 (-) Transcript_61916:83-667(-)
MATSVSLALSHSRVTFATAAKFLTNLPASSTAALHLVESPLPSISIASSRFRSSVFMNASSVAPPSERREKPSTVRTSPMNSLSHFWRAICSRQLRQFQYGGFGDHLCCKAPRVLRDHPEGLAGVGRREGDHPGCSCEVTDALEILVRLLERHPELHLLQQCVQLSCEAVAEPATRQSPAAQTAPGRKDLPAQK